MTWAYVAGFFDGEGWLGLRSTTGIKNKKRGIQPYVAITQADKEGGKQAIEKLREFLTVEGIKSHFGTRAKQNAKWRDCFSLRIGGRPGVEKFLRGVLPYLIVRRVFAQDLLRFLFLYPSLPKGPNHQSGFRRFRSST